MKEIKIVSERKWKKKRLKRLRKAIKANVLNSNSFVPAEWTEELNNLMIEIYGSPYKICFGKPGEENDFNTIDLRYVKF